jgi:cytochrome c-type biogenesis protein CcmF
MLLLLPAAVGLVVATGLWALGVEGGLPLATFGLCAFVATAAVRDLFTHTPARRRFGAYLIHVGVALMYLGFAGDAYKQERELVMQKGQRVTVGDYTLRYDGIRREVDDQKQMTTATLSVYEADERTGRRLATLRPARWVYFKHQRQPTSEVDIRRSAAEDLFVILGGFDINKGTAAIKVVINALVNWIWIGFLLLSIGAVITFIPMGLRSEPSKPKTAEEKAE